VKRPTLVAALGTTLVAGIAATAMPAQAAVSSATKVDTTATLNLDGADDNVTITAQNGVLVHGQVGGGLNSTKDWDSTTPDDQTVPANGTWSVVVNSGEGNDSVTVLAKDTEVHDVTLNGEGGDDVLTGADSADVLNGGEGNDRLVGAKGPDTMNGGNGNDTMVWNNGDNTDTIDGGGGNDATEVNGSGIAGDAFQLDPDAGPNQVKFQRTNLGTFTLHATTERFQVNGLGGNDTLVANDGVGARTLLSVDGGAGVDTISGSDGPDLIQGGEGNDVLSGGGGDDRIVGDRGGDAMNGGAGDDTLVWNNGDGTDVVNGDAGRDDVEVNGAPAAGDAFTVQPNGARIKFERTNLVTFSLDIGSAETLHANGLGGDDTIAIGDVGSYAVTASGGSGNDTLTGGPSADTLLGGSGDDTINGGGGLDVVQGDDGDDTVDIRDNTADVARGGDGSDLVIADGADLDVIDGFETVDRPAVVVPPPVVNPNPNPVDTTTLPVAIKGGTLKVANGVASIALTCPANSPGKCTGTLEIRTAGSVKLAGLKVVVRLGSAHYTIAPGTTKTVKVRLAKGAQRLADRNGHLKVRAIATTGPAGKTASSSKSVTLALGKTR
jgi:Ca2+-binding RTX toxin-like protein